MPRLVARAVELRAGPTSESEVLAELSAGETFEVLELAGINAWGVAAAPGLVGYIEANALGEAPGA